MQKITSDKVFNASQERILAALAELMIPADESLGVPAASDDVIFGRIVRGIGEHERLVTGGLDSLEDIARNSSAGSFADLSTEAQIAVVDRLGRESPFVQLFSSVVIQSYYQDPRVLDSLGMAARPPFPEGHELEQGDWSLLDPVRARAKIYRET